MNTPNPGLQEAIEQGCTCPVIDNNYGKGYRCFDGSTFAYTVGCPVHVTSDDVEKPVDNSVED
jgi:hypothetical protein